MKKSFILALLAAVLGFSSCSNDDVEIRIIKVESITLSASEVQLAIGGDMKQATTTLTAIVTPENAAELGVEWSSSDVKVATVNSEGVVIAEGEGTAVITATTKEGGKSASCTVTVKRIIDDWNHDDLEILP